MNFTSIAFYCLFISCIISLGLLQKIKGKNSISLYTIILVICSIVFCGWQDWKFAAIIIVESIFAYFMAIKISQTQKKIFLIIGVCVNLGFLGIFKYYNFFVDTIGFFYVSLKKINLFLPLGISFYTFSAIGYLIDVYRKKYMPEKNIFNVILYMSFFPKLTAGPIISADKFLEQLKKVEQKITLTNIGEGPQIILQGLIKKNVFADHIGEFVNIVYSNVTMYNMPTLLLAILGYGVQIYFDFSGYSDIAIGCSKCLGFTMPTNFNLPYLSRNITEFWKRWHITLSDWLMNYLYIPLGGNRKGHIRTFINLFLTMVIGGLWHGASWNFVLWGALHGIALCIHKQFMKTKKISKDFVPSLPKFIMGVLGTYLFTNFCWIFFRITDIRVIGQLLYRIGTCSTGVAFYSWWTIIGIGFMIISTSITIMKNFWNQKREKCNYTSIQAFYVKKDLSKFRNLVLFFFLIGLVIGLAYADSNPFIYAAF